MTWKFWKTSYYGGNPESGFIGNLMRVLLGLALLYLLAAAAIGIWWSREPDLFDVSANASVYAAEDGVEQIVTGYTTATAFHRIADTLLSKPGGYLSNDKFPPGLWLDNMPNWEFGALTQMRDMSRAMRIDFARSQSQSAADEDLELAEGQFFFDNSSWIFPQTEDEYTKGIKMVRSYAKRLSSEADSDGQFYARADNLQRWLEGVESRLGNLSQQLSASVGKRQLDLGLAGDATATQSTPTASDDDVKTPWLKLDDVFFEARGHTWALIHLPVMSPMILNGEGLGFVANHSLVMASYISRANAGIIDLRSLLSRG